MYIYFHLSLLRRSGAFTLGGGVALSQVVSRLPRLARYFSSKRRLRKKAEPTAFNEAAAAIEAFRRHHLMLYCWLAFGVEGAMGCIWSNTIITVPPKCCRASSLLDSPVSSSPVSPVRCRTPAPHPPALAVPVCVSLHQPRRRPRRRPLQRPRQRPRRQHPHRRPWRPRSRQARRCEASLILRTTKKNKRNAGGAERSVCGTI